jgi:hypothetical protein
VDPEGFQQQKDMEAGLSPPIDADELEIELTGQDQKADVFMQGEDEEEKEGEEHMQSESMKRGLVEEEEEEEETKEGERDDIALEISGTKIRANSVESLTEDGEEGEFLEWSEWPPMRTAYCKAAKRYVASYDHFCPFLNTPIGERNHARFWWFLLMELNSINWAIAVVHTGFVPHSWNHGEWMSVNGHAFATALILYLTVLFVGPLFLFHTFLAMTNMLTREFMRAEELEYLKGTQDFDLPFSESFSGNIRGFCVDQDAFTSWIASLVCCFCSAKQKVEKWSPVKWRRQRQIVRDSEDWQNHLWHNKYWSCC